jgi:hypothetical protein
MTSAAGSGNDPSKDGYREVRLPEFGSLPDATAEQVTEISIDWYVAETDFVRHMMRPLSRNVDDQQEAGSITTLSFFQAVRNGNGIARVVRDHIEGRAPIREPKAVFIRTIEYHRRAAVLWLIERRADDQRTARPREDGHTGEVDLEAWARQRLQVLGGAQQDDGRVGRCLQIRSGLVELAEAADVSADARPSAEAWLEELESCCVEALRKHDVLGALTARQRTVFLLRIDPLNTDDDTALEYRHIEQLSDILGMPMNLPNLRQTLRAAVLRLRKLHPDLRDELGHG